MNLWLRVLWVIVTGLFRPRIGATGDVGTLRLRVLPNDLDTNLHLNNGRYLTLMDLGRLDLVLRSGLWRIVRARGWMPVLSCATTRFRRELRVFRAFRLETRMLYWTGTLFVIEHRVVAKTASGDDILSAISLQRGGFYERTGRRFVPVADVLTAMGLPLEPPPPRPDVLTFLDAEDALRRAR